MVTGSLIPGDRWQKMQIIVQSFILVLSTFGILECSAANPDPCSQKYTSLALGRSGALFCSDAYFGGDPACCFNEATLSCSTCVSKTTCSNPTLCFDRLQGCGWNASIHTFSAAFTQRSATCIYDSQGLGYWRDPNYAIRGTFSTLVTVSGGIPLSICAQQCSALKSCSAFQWGSECVLVGGSFTDICDLQQVGCSSPFTTGSFYSADFGSIYCGRSVKTCACSREYYYCMRSEGCFTSESDLAEFSDVCVSEGCTATQCGLPQVFCNSSNTCDADFLACNEPISSISSFESPYKCSCIKDFTKCLSAAGCLSQVESRTTSKSAASKVSISQIQEWCIELNCTALDCGLSQPICNVSTKACDTAFSACHGSGVIALKPQRSASMFTIGASGLSLAGNSGVTTSSGGVVANRGVYAGRYYWEVTIQGRCAFFGVANENYNTSKAPGFDQNSWSLGDTRGFGQIFFNATTMSTPSNTWFSSSGPLTIGIALDASSGRVWIQKDSVWLSGDPGSSAGAAFTAKYQYLFPVFGSTLIDSECGAALPSIKANFGGTSFKYQVPAGFVRFQTNDCDCSTTYKGCLEGLSCSDSKPYVAALAVYTDACNAGNCTVSGKNRCKESYISCQNLIANTISCSVSNSVGCKSECDCLRGWRDCILAEKCSSNSSDFEDYRAACYRMGCYEKCDPTFKTPCNISSSVCTSSYITCQLQATGKRGSCGCLSDLYQCIDGNMCWTDSDLIPFAKLCVDRNCSALECGFPPSIADETRYIWCTSPVRTACQAIYSTCLAQHSVTQGGQIFDGPSDRCYANYNISSIPVDERLRGPTFCQDATKGGVSGCLYYEDQDSCYTPSTCSCVGSFYDCMDSGACVRGVDRDSYANTCDQIGCTAQQCGLHFTLCNETSINVCGSKYLKCEENIQAYKPLLSAFGIQNVDSQCYSAYCLGHWVQCLNAGNCSSPISLKPPASYLQQCSATLGCTLQGCSVSLANDPQLPPDSPVEIQLTSLLGAKLMVAWRDSLRAIQWVLTDSSNSLISYQISISRFVDSNAVLIRKVILEFSPSPRQVIFEGLSVGTVYVVAITARNRFDKGPSITGSERLNGPPSEPLLLMANRTGALRADLSWSPPQDFGDTTQTRPLSFYTVRLSLTPRRSYNEPYTMEINVSGLTFAFGSEDIPVNAASLMAGDVLSARVAAVNTLAQGRFTEPAEIKLMGYPSGIVSLVSSETLIGINISWILPDDAGFGIADASLIVESIIHLSTSTDFDPGNSSFASISVKSVDTCTGLYCTFLIIDGRYNYVEGTLYYIRVFAVNEVGYVATDTARFISQPWRIKSPPTIPRFVRLARRANVPLQVELSWDTPENTGDGTQIYSRFSGYFIQVSVLSSSGLTYQITTGKSVKLLRIGVKQIGDVSGATAFQSISVSAGSVVQVRIAAQNDRGSSGFITTQPIMMMGIPSAVQFAAALEQVNGIVVTWQTPTDTGFGTASRVQATRYEITVCSGVCETVLDDFFVDSSRNELSFDVGYSYLIPSYILGIQSIKYFVNIYSWNSAGKGSSVCPTFCPGQSPALGILVGWKIFPAIQFPQITAQKKLQVAEYASVTTIWDIQSGLNFSSIPILVINFPLQTASTILLVPVSKGSIILSGRATVDAVITDLMTNKDDETGIDSFINFGFQTPFFGTGAGPANGVISVAKYPTKSVSIPMDYFLYPETLLIQISPTSGPTSGGFRVSAMFYEPLGFKTRSGAGIETIFNANQNAIGVNVQGADATVLGKEITPSGQVFNVYLLIYMPPGDSSILSSISFLISGSLLKTVSFQYRDAYIVLVSPAAALTDGNDFISIIIGGISGADQFSGAVAIEIMNSFCLQPKVISINSVVVGGLADTQAVVSGLTPSFNVPSDVLPGKGFLTNILVSIFRSDGSSLKVRGTNVFQLYVPNTPFISSISIQASSNKIPFSQPTLIVIQVKFLLLDSKNSLQIQFGYPQYDFTGKLSDCGQVVCTCANPCSQFQGGLQDNYITSIRVLTPKILAFQATATLSVSILVNGTVKAVGKSLDFYDPGAAQIMSVQPSEVRSSGGTVLLLGLVGFCDIACPPSGFKISFNGVSGEVIGFVSLTSWQNMDSTVLDLLSAPKLESIRAGYRVSDSKVVGNVQSFITSNPQVVSDSLYLLYVATPALSRAGLVNMSVISVDDASRVIFFTILNTVDPTSSAQGTITPTQILLSDLRLQSKSFDIFLQPFQLIYSSSEVVIYLSSADGLERNAVPSNYISVLSSTFAGTFLRLTLPQCPNNIIQCTGGILNLQIYPIAPVARPDNVGLLEIQILDQINALDPLPSIIYTAGNDTVQIVMTSLYLKTPQVSNFRISLTSGDGIMRTAQTACPNTNRVAGTCSFLLDVSAVVSDFKTQTTTISFLSPQIPDLQGRGAASNSNGVATIQISYVPSRQTSKTVSIIYVQTPQGAASIIQLLPSQGSTLGNFLMNVRLTNFRRVVKVLDLAVEFGSDELGWLPAAVQDSGFLSGFTLTSFSVMVPASVRAGVVTVRIVNSGRMNNAGEGNFLYIDNSVAVISYPIGPPWPRGDSSIENVLAVGVTGLGKAVQTTEVSFSLAGLPTILQQVPVLKSLRSTSELTQLDIILPAIPNLNISSLVKITIAFVFTGQSKEVFLYYEYLADSAPFVVSFSPTNYNTDGGIPMQIEVVNLPILSIQTHQQVMFGTGLVVNATSVSILPQANRARIFLVIPSSTLSQSIVPQIIVAQNSSSFLLPFPSPFTFTSPPQVVIQSFFPTRASIRNAVRVSLRISNFPGVDSVNRLSDIAIKFGTAKLDAAVLSFSRVDPSKPLMAVQDIVVLVNSPIITVTDSAYISAFHRSFDYRSAISSVKFSFYDPSLPSFLGISSGTSGQDPSKIYVKSSTIDRVVITIQNFPLTNILNFASSADDLAISIDTNPVAPASFQLSATRQAVIVIQTPASTPRDAVVSVNFGYLNSSFFQDIPAGFELNFVLRYYDDAIPVLNYIIPSTGSELGGFVVVMALKNFPVVSKLDDALVKLFTSDSAAPIYAQVVAIQTSDQTSTIVRVRMPQVAVLSGISKVQVSVSSATDENKATGALPFDYIDTPPSIVSAFPSTGTSLGGTPIDLKIINFPSNLLPLRVTFETASSITELQQGTALISVIADMLGNSVYLSIVTPISDPGTATIVVYSFISGPSDAVRFSFQVIDASTPILDLPLPSSACIQDSGKTIYIYLQKVTSPQALEAAGNKNVTAQFGLGTAARAAEDVGQVSNGRMRLAFLTPTLTSPMSLDMYITIGIYSISQAVPISFRDCSVPSIISVRPSSVLNIGGNIITVALQNIPVLTYDQFFVKVGDEAPVDATVMAVSRNNISAITFLTLVTPQLPYKIGDQNVYISYSVPGFSIKTLMFLINIQVPCDFDVLCSQVGKVVAVHLLQSSPPASQACLATYSSLYCISPQSIPFPTLLSIIPSQGLIGQTSQVKAQISAFPALLMNQNFFFQVITGISIQLVSGRQNRECQLVKTEVSGDNFFSQITTLTFNMPTDTDIQEGQMQILMTANYGSTGKVSSQVVVRAVNSFYTFIRPVSGELNVIDFFPSECLPEDCPSMTFTVLLGNFPYYNMNIPFDISQIVLVVENLTSTVSSISSPSRSSTIATFSLPPNFNYSNPNSTAKIRFVYTPFGRQLSRCVMISKGICLDRAGTALLTILSPKAPLILDIYPDKLKQGATSEDLLVYLTIGYGPKNLKTIDWNARLIWQAISIETQQMAVVDTEDLSDESCKSSSCSISSVTLQAPPHITAVSNEATIELCLAANPAICVRNVLKYSAYVVQVEPTSLEVLSDFDPNNLIDVYVDGYDFLKSSGCLQVHCSAPPSSQCSCSRLRISCNLNTDCVSEPQIKMFENSEIFYLSVALSRPKKIGVVSFNIHDDTDPVKPPASFEVEFLQPPPVVLPSDGPTGQATTVTVTAHWGVAQTPITVSILGRGSFTSQAVSIYDSYSEVRLTIPPAMASTPGVVRISLNSSPQVYTAFDFEFFQTPKVVSLQPSQGTVDGRVGECATCLTNSDGKTVSVWIQNFPFVEDDDFERISVTFGQAVCDGTDSSSAGCDVSNIQTILDPLSGGQLLYITVSVPASQNGLPSAVTIFVEYIPINRDANLMSSRVASAVFTYIALPTVFNWIAVCASCSASGPCIRGGVCADGSAAAMYTSTYPQPAIPSTGNVTLIVSIQNFPEFKIDSTTKNMLLPSACKPSDLCGLSLSPPSIGHIKQALSSASSSALLEIVLLSSTRQSVDASINIRTEVGGDLRVASFSITYYDSRFFGSAVQTRFLTSQGPIEGGIQVELIVSNFLTLDSSITFVDDIMTLTFGDQAANGLQVTQIQNEGRQYTLIVQVPSFACVVCPVSSGIATVPVTLQAIGNQLLSAKLYFIYIRAPMIMSARFNIAGTGLEVAFDQDTDRGGASAATTLCNRVLNSSLFGSSPTCIWSTSSLLLVFFGDTPLLVPGNSISIIPNSLRSSGGLSTYARSTPRIVLNPLIVQKPAPISIKGPSEIDSCSDLMLVVTVPSPRALSYVWTCADSSELSRALQGFGRTVFLSNVTLAQPRFATWSDKAFTISVYAVDFLGSKSDVVSIQVRRKSVPSPQISFFGNSIYSAQQDILLRGEAAFSSCRGAAQSQLVFKWISNTGQNIQQIDFDKLNIRTDSSQLFIRALSIIPGKQYSVTLTVTLSSDRAKTSQKTFNFATSQSALVARISGGSALYISSVSGLNLDASNSLDPDRDSSNFTFTWSCSFNNGRGLIQSCSNANGGQIGFPNAAVLQYASGTIAASKFPYVFSVAVSKPKRTGSSASVSVYVTDLPIPQLGIQQNFTAWSSQGIPQISPSDKIRLAGFSPDSEISHFSWSLQSGNTTISLPQAFVPLGTSNMNFVLNPITSDGNPASASGENVLIPGITYTVILQGEAADSKAQGQASIQFAYIQPPQSGSCTTCKYTPTSSSACQPVGIALIDTFRISCNGWADVNQPLKYRFGIRSEQGDEWFDYVPDNFRDFRLSSGRVTLLAIVVNNLGAATTILTSTVTVNSIPGSGRRMLLQLLTSTFDQVVVAVNTAYLAGRADTVNQISFSFATELDSAYNSSRINLMDVSIYKQNLTSYIYMSMPGVILTVGYAEETSTSLSNVVQNPTHLTGLSVMTSVRTILQISNVDTRGRSMSNNFVRNIIDVVDSTGCTLVQTCANSSQLSALSFTDLWQWMNFTRDASYRVMTGLLTDVFNGEPAVTITGRISNVSSAKANLNLLSLNGVGNGLSFTLLATDAITVSAFSSFSLIADVIRSRFNISSRFFAGLSLSIPLGNLQGASKSVIVRIPMDPQAALSKSPNQRLNNFSFICAWWDAATGRMNPAGCQTKSVYASTVECECDHLTEFALIDTRNRSDVTNQSECAVSCDNGVCTNGSYCACKINWFGRNCSVKLSYYSAKSELLSFIGGISQFLIITLVSGESVTIPTGAVDQALWNSFGVTTITFAVYSLSELPLIVNQSLAAEQSFSGSFVSLFPSGLQFKKTVALSLRTISPLSVGKNTSIHYYNEQNALWDFRQSNLDSTSGTISSDLLHFSTYAVIAFPFGTSQVAQTPAPTSGGQLPSDTTPDSPQTSGLIGRTSTPPASTPSPESGGSSLIPIIAGVVGGFVAVVALIAFIVIRRRNARAVQVEPLTQPLIEGGNDEADTLGLAAGGLARGSRSDHALDAGGAGEAIAAWRPPEDQQVAPAAAAPAPPATPPRLSTDEMVGRPGA